MAVSTSPASPPSVTCPSCHATMAAGSKFCNQCGSALSGAPATVSPSGAAPAVAGSAGPPGGGAPPVDLRTRVDDDRGMLKRLQMLIPGYRGYRVGEDLRAADSLLRLQVADRVHRAVVAVQDCRQSLTQAGLFQGLNELAPALAELQQLEGEIRHAEQGYTGISPAIRVQPQQQETLYQYDYGFVSAADQVTQTLAPLQTAAGGGNAAQVTAAIQQVRAQYRQLDTAFKARMRAVEGIQV